MKWDYNTYKEQPSWFIDYIAMRRVGQSNANKTKTRMQKNGRK